MKYNIPALESWARKSAAQFWDYARRVFPDIGDMPVVVMNSRLTSTAGRCWTDGSKIDLSCYLMTNNFEHFHKDTIPHELCHAIVCRLWPNAKGHHNAEWYYVVDTLKVTTSRCHSLETLAQSKRKR